jgi:16S rRNA (guanine527-N7)-methyltransferase
MTLNAVEQYASYFIRPHDQVLSGLERYESLLRKWQVVQNLVSRETLDRIWERHFADSLQLLKHLDASEKSIWDLGSGGGLPALPLAIAVKGSHRKFTLVEPNARKVSFLRTVVRELELDATVVGERIDAIDSRETPDVITSRALASLTQLCGWMAPRWGSKTRALLHKGREHGEEILQAATLWDFDVVTEPSDTDADAAILVIRNLRARAGS